MLKLAFKENDLDTAHLYLNLQNSAKISRLVPSVIDITSRFQPERKRVENFIKRIYKKFYNADISVDYPVLMSVRDANGKIMAALGIRYACSENLFLEQYTQAPIDHILSTPRSQIVEIGNLASAGRGASVFLFAALSSYLKNKDIQIAAMTGTESLHRSFEKMGIHMRKICDADIKSLKGVKDNWGSYYDAHPRVIYGLVEEGVERFKEALGAEFKACRPRLYPRLHYISKHSNHN